MCSVIHGVARQCKADYSGRTKVKCPHSEITAADVFTKTTKPINNKSKVYEVTEMCVCVSVTWNIKLTMFL